MCERNVLLFMCFYDLIFFHPSVTFSLIEQPMYIILDFALFNLGVRFQVMCSAYNRGWMGTKRDWLEFCSRQELLGMKHSTKGLIFSS